MPYIPVKGFNEAQRNYDNMTPFDDDINEDAILDRQNEVFDARMDDIEGYFLEALDEADRDDLKNLGGMCKSLKYKEIGKLFVKIQRAYNWIDEGEALELMKEDAKADQDDEDRKKCLAEYKMYDEDYPYPYYRKV